jgi:ribose transport system substrate-binding protein
MRAGQRWRSRWCLALLAIVALLAVGCGGSDNESAATTTPAADSGGTTTEAASGGKAAAQQIVDEAMKIPEFKLQAPAFDASKAKGKTIFNVVFRSGDAYIDAQTKQMEEIAGKYGVKMVSFATNGTPNEWAKGIEQAIAQKADLILIETDPHAVLPQLQKAKKAGIPVVLLHWYATGEPVPDDVAPLITAQITAPFHEGHRMDVAYAVSQTDGPVNALIVQSSDITPSEGIVASMKKDFEELCGSECKVKVIDVPAVKWATGMTSAVRTALNEDPTINWVMPLFDAMTLTAAPAITAAGKTGKVKIATFNGTPAVMNLMNTGKVLVADAGENVNWLGYAFMDQSLRVLSGVEPIADGNEETALRLFTPDNIGEAGNPPKVDQGYGDAYVKGYEQLWSGE